MKATTCIILLLLTFITSGCNPTEKHEEPNEVSNADKQHTDSNLEKESQPYRVKDIESLEDDLFIQLTNQSRLIDPADFVVYIDGELIISVELPTLDAHYHELYGIPIRDGMHEIRIVSEKGQTETEITINKSGRRFLLAIFWTPGKIQIMESDEPFGIS